MTGYASSNAFNSTPAASNTRYPTWLRTVLWIDAATGLASGAMQLAVPQFLGGMYGLSTGLVQASAMVVLKAKLLARKKAEEKAHLDGLRGDVQASWGDQMRNYVLNPYQVVKDLRTGYEQGNPSTVFDGELDGFLEAGIRWRRGSDNAEV